MLRRFLHIWFVYWLAIALLPVSSVYSGTSRAFLLQVAFVSLVSLVLWLIVAEARIGPLPPAGRVDIPGARLLVWSGIILSTLGLAALTYDKVVIQGVDFSMGLAYAREQWRELAEAREGKPSSAFSMIGYLLGSAYYVSAVLALTHIRISSGERIWALVLSFVLLMANSALSGGRSNLLLFGAVTLAALWSRQGLTLRLLLPRASQRHTLFLLAALAVVYLVFIFYQRALISELKPLDYVLYFLPFLGIRPSEWFFYFLQDAFFGPLWAMVVLTVTYITHSFATVAAIMDAPSEDKTVLFVHAANILYKLNLSAQLQADWFLAGRMPSVPGALWHEFGLTGFIVGSVLLGTVCALIRIWAIRRPTQLLALGALVMAEATLILTPAQFALDMLSFPFAAVSFAILAAVWYAFRTALLVARRLRSCALSRSRT